MINFLHGKIQNKLSGSVVVNVRDVGYKVFVNSVDWADLEIGQSVDFYTYQHVREDILALYGFSSPEELAIFELLLSISGVGPKSALGVIAIATVADISDSIARGDSSLLVKVPGIGKKTAERVVLELRDKVEQSVNSDRGLLEQREVNSSGDEIDALMSLGYSLQQARDALRKIDSDIKDSGERVRKALQLIN